MGGLLQQYPVEYSIWVLISTDFLSIKWPTKRIPHMDTVWQNNCNNKDFLPKKSTSVFMHVT